jgi:hypothetical protein
VKVIGCGVNPADSLALAEPSLSIGSVVHFELDNPLGTQSAGAATVLALSVAPNAAYPCGVLVPGLGMSGFGAMGELLLNPNPGSFLDPIPGPLWPGSPATITIGVPSPTPGRPKRSSPRARSSIRPSAAAAASGSADRGARDRHRLLTSPRSARRLEPALASPAESAPRSLSTKSRSSEGTTKSTARPKAAISAQSTAGSAAAS